MKANELKEKTVSELNSMLVDLKTELFNLRFQLVTGQLENTSRIKIVKKDIARVKTVLREHELKVSM